MSLGTFLKVDRLTSIHSRGKFERICVEIELDKPLASHIMVRGCPLLLEYEGLHAICFRYGKFGHKKDQCREVLVRELYAQKEVATSSNDVDPVVIETAQQNTVRANVTMANPKQDNIPKDQVVTKQELIDPIEYGSWMIAKRYSWRKPWKNSYKS